jgi:hypothetical protein
VLELVGNAGDSLALAMRIIVCAYLGIKDEADMRALLPLQCEDGGWETGESIARRWLTRYLTSLGRLVLQVRQIERDGRDSRVHDSFGRQVHRDHAGMGTLVAFRESVPRALETSLPMADGNPLLITPVHARIADSVLAMDACPLDFVLLAPDYSRSPRRVRISTGVGVPFWEG